MNPVYCYCEHKIGDHTMTGFCTKCGCLKFLYDKPKSIEEQYRMERVDRIMAQRVSRFRYLQ